jgi:hypothetical protein
VYAEGRAFVDDELYVNGELYSDGNFHALSNAEVDGDVAVHGNLTWDAKTSYVSVSAAAFRPIWDGHDFWNQGDALYNEDGSSDFYVAPVQLPHRATVTKLTFYWWDASDWAAACTLRRNDLAGGTETQMAYAETFGDTGLGSSVDSTVGFAEVDNSQYAYYLQLQLQDTEMHARGVVIEYTITGPY